MNIRKLSINKACVFLGVLLLLATGFISAAVYVLTRNTTAVWYILLFSLFVLLCVICFWCYTKKMDSKKRKMV